MNELSQIQSSQLLAKISSDLKHGYKVKGNYSRQSDVVRVWCRRPGSERHFMIAATSDKRFGEGGNYRLGFLTLDGKLMNVDVEQTSAGNDFSFQDFMALFFDSPTDRELTLYKMDRDGHGPGDLELLD